MRVPGKINRSHFKMSVKYENTRWAVVFKNISHGSLVISFDSHHAFQSRGNCIVASGVYCKNSIPLWSRVRGSTVLFGDKSFSLLCLSLLKSSNRGFWAHTSLPLSPGGRMHMERRSLEQRSDGILASIARLGHSMRRMSRGSPVRAETDLMLCFHRTRTCTRILPFGYKR